MTTAKSPYAAAILDQLEMWGLKLGLGRIKRTLAALGRPDRAFPIVLIAGTNGKGSTAALLASILNAAGYRTGLFTSPHLQSVRERIRVDGVAITDSQLCAALERVVETTAADPDDPLPSYFEAITAAALINFADASVDVAVLEVGLGGRLDATNATEPILSAITSIGHDHQEHLGHRLDQIAREKAGVARPGRPLLVWAPGQAGVQKVLREQAARGVSVEDVWRHTTVTTLAPPESGFEVALNARPPSGPARSYRFAQARAASHHHTNTAMAARAAEHLKILGFERIEGKSIIAGVEQCRWPGRLELVEIESSRGPRKVLLDGAHNLAGARALTKYLANSGLSDSLGMARSNLLFASLRKKNAAESLQALAPCVDRIWLTSPTSHRALDGRELAAQLKRYQPILSERCLAIDQFADALEQAIDASPNGLVVCGSLYAVGEARTWLHQRYNTPTAAADISLFG